MVFVMPIRQNGWFSTRLSEKEDDLTTDNETSVPTDNETSVQEAKSEVTEPPMYQVVILNDDYTPMDFVVDILVHLFSKNRVQATQIMLQIHQLGKGICGRYTSDVAETKVALVNSYAKECSHPLMALMEKL